jgi:hypothetical protein
MSFVVRSKWVFIVVSFGLVLSSARAHAGGGTSVGGGGNATEIRVDEIRADILKWIDEGGAQGLTLPSHLTHSQYVSGMRKVLEPLAVVVVAVTPEQEAAATDDELKVVVEGRSKTCRGFVSRKDRLPHILCSTKRFAETTESDQYRLIHHEYAGLAGIERNVGAASDYEISSQLTDFLVPRTVLKLAIKRRADRVMPNLGDIVRNADGSVRSMTWDKADRYCRDQGTRLPTPRELAIYSQSLGAVGIRETDYPGVFYEAPQVMSETYRMLADGYSPILTSTRKGEVSVDFYFNNKNYRPPKEEDYYFVFWSSVIQPGYRTIKAYAMRGGDGFIDLQFLDDYHHCSSVRCVE